MWHERYDPQSIEKVHHYLESIIEDDGPYDGIIGFSEGAALAASYLLSKEYRASLGELSGEPENELKLAMFFNSVKPYSPSEDIGCDASEEFQQELRRHSDFLKGEEVQRRKSSLSEDLDHINALSERRQSMVSQRRDSIIAWRSKGFQERRDSISSSDDEVTDCKAQAQLWNSLFSPVLCFDPDSFPCKVQIPTLHAIGARDPFINYSTELTKLCDPEQMEIVLLDIGHDIPRTGEGLTSIVDAIELITMMAAVGNS